jgi:hypothetical protein
VDNKHEMQDSKLERLYKNVKRLRAEEAENPGGEADL